MAEMPAERSRNDDYPWYLFVCRPIPSCSLVLPIDDPPHHFGRLQMTESCRVYGGDVAVNESVVMNESKLPFVTTREQTRRFHCVNGRYGYLIINLDQYGS